MCHVFRVKELGPGGPVEGKPADLPPPNYGGALSPQNSDLAMLRTGNVSVVHVQLKQVITYLFGKVFFRS